MHVRCLLRCVLRRVLGPKITIQLIRQEHTNGNKHGTKMLVYYIPTQNIITVPIFGQSQNMSWDELGQVGTNWDELGQL